MVNDHQVGTLRIIDAALNRAGEGFRVVEDYLRMALNDAHLSRLAKQLRHDLGDLAQSIAPAQRHAMRDTLGDVGTEVTTTHEANRDSAADVAAASFRRTAEALRTVEEYGKLIDASLSAKCEQLRYRLYTLEKATTLTRDAAARLSGVELYVLIDGAESEWKFGQLVSSLTAAGVGAIQLRDKSLNDGTLARRARQLVDSTRPTDCLAIVNDRPDIAVAAGADGVHLGQDDLSVAAARKVVGPGVLVGVSTHHINQARQAVLEGANYLGAGPTFASNTKQFEDFPGLDYLRQVATEIALPTFAIGGIDKQNLPAVLATGTTRVAVAGAITGAQDASETASAMLKQLKNASDAKTASKV